MSNFIDLTGSVFGRLTVQSRAGTDNTGRALWACECSCGKTAVVPGYKLRRGSTLSCGCLRAERMRDLNLSKRKRRSHSPEIVAAAKAAVSRR